MKRLFALLGIAAFALSACATRALQMPAATAAPSMPELGVAPFRQDAAGGAPGYGYSNDASKSTAEMPAAAPVPAEPQAQTTNRMVIQNAQLSIVVADVDARVAAVQSMTKAMGGFIVSVNVYQTVMNDGEPVPQAQMVVRVPQEKLEDALTQIKKDTVDVQNETRSGNDVTDQYVDLQSRLKAKQAAEEQLLTIMKDAKRTEDVLAVYNQLQQIESDIEVLKGQIKYYEQSAALSAIEITIIAEKTVQPIQVAGWKPQGVARDAIQQLIYFWQAFVDFIIRLVLYILPVLITIAIPVFLLVLLVRWFFRKIRRPKVLATVEEPKK